MKQRQQTVDTNHVSIRTHVITHNSRVCYLRSFLAMYLSSIIHAKASVVYHDIMEIGTVQGFSLLNNVCLAYV